MANTDRPRGFWPKGEIKQQIVAVAGSKVVAGEFVSLADDGMVDAAAAGATIFGLAMGYASASGEKILVSVAPDQLYVGQADETEIDAQTDIGNLCDIVATAENSTYNAPRMEIDSSTIGTGAGGQLVILGIEPSIGNALGAQADVVVKVNEPQVFGAAFAGV